MDITLSKYQADVFLRTEELYSTIGFRNVPLFEDEYRLSKATAEYITNNISVSGGNIENDAIQTYNAVLGIVITSTGTGTTTSGTTTSGTTTGGTTIGSGASVGTTVTETLGLTGVFPTLVSLSDFIYDQIGQTQQYNASYTDVLNPSQAVLTVGTQLTPVTPTTNIPNGYYIINTSTEQLQFDVIRVSQGSVSEVLRQQDIPQPQGSGQGSGNNGGPINPV
jgi:hypothetical protein